jgi:uncharacterized DUF497 family protein
VEFEWDPAKSERNLRERGLSFETAGALFAGSVVEWTDTRRDYGETRMLAIGLIGERVAVCIYTDRCDLRRIISLRYANRDEQDDLRKSQKRRH